MTVLSARHAPAAIALLVATALPVWIHAALAPVRDDCADIRRFVEAPRIGGAESVPFTHKFKRSRVAAEGRLTISPRLKLYTRVVRDTDSARFVISPSAYGFDPLRYMEGTDLRWIAAGDDRLPVHWSAGSGRHTAQVEAFAYVHAGRPVVNPIRSGLELALPQLLEGTQPITILIVSGTATPDESAALDAAVEAWLVAAWQELEAACRP